MVIEMQIIFINRIVIYHEILFVYISVSDIFAHKCVTLQAFFFISSICLIQLKKTTKKTLALICHKKKKNLNSSRSSS